MASKHRWELTRLHGTHGQQRGSLMGFGPWSQSKGEVVVDLARRLMAWPRIVEVTCAATIKLLDKCPLGRSLWQRIGL